MANTQKIVEIAIPNRQQGEVVYIILVPYCYILNSRNFKKKEKKATSNIILD